MSRKSINVLKKLLAVTPAARLPIPSACFDPAFMACIKSAISTHELVQQFDRLYGCSLSRARSPIEQMIDKATGYQDDQLRKFTEFVHDSIYLRLPDEAINAFRLAAIARPDLEVAP